MLASVFLRIFGSKLQYLLLGGIEQHYAFLLMSFDNSKAVVTAIRKHAYSFL